jgi:hypothetical protein
VKRENVKHEEKGTIDARRIGITAAKALREIEPGWSVDELLLHPRVSLRVVHATNLRLSIRRADHEVLRALLNCRKRGDLKSSC